MKPGVVLPGVSPAGGGTVSASGPDAPGSITPGSTTPAPSPDPRRLFAELIGEEEQTALLLDARGFVLAGAFVDEEGRDIGHEVGAELSGVSDEVERAMRHLDIGRWHSLVLETRWATVAMAPTSAGGLLLVAAERATPIGLVRRLLDRAAARARAWLERGR